MSEPSVADLLRDDDMSQQMLIDEANALDEATLIEREAWRLRINYSARKVVEHERHAATWRAPELGGSLKDQLAEPLPEITYAIQRLLPAGGNATLTAQFKAGKTTIVNNLAKAYADNQRFLGKWEMASSDRNLAYFNYEVSEAQWLRWMDDLKIENQDRIYPLHLRGKRLPLLVPQIENWVVDWLQRNNIGTWIIDPYGRAYGGKENDNSDVRAFLDAIDVIKDRAGVDQAVMTLHTGRADQQIGEERGRGATVLDDWADARWLLTRGKGVEEQRKRFFSATGRDVEVDEEELKFEPATRKLTMGGWDRYGSKRRGDMDRVKKIIVDQPGISQTALAETVGIDRRSLTKEGGAVYRLLAGREVRVEKGKNNESQYYV